ncbi:MAG: cell division protein FtsQ/DivIB [Alphaproteobacteria bacterium]|nr:cell division protein FtsQ/DivIB [Alphaproteobacteria bacterium]
MKRSIMFWVYFIVAIVLGIYLTTRIIMNGMGYGRGAIIHNVSITADSSDADLTTIQTVAASGLGTRTGALNLETLNNRIRSVPGVRNAATRRMPNGTLSIDIELHRAVAQWYDGVAYFPLSADGTWVNIPSDTRDAGAIVFRGALPDNISDITDATKSLADKIDYIEWIENRRWNIVTNDGITIMLPESNPVAAVRGLISLNENQHILNRELKVIDMRDNARILVK